MTTRLASSWLAFCVLACSSAGPRSSVPDSSGQSDASGAPSSAELSAMLTAHNQRRAEHCASQLVWSDALAGVARTWADQLANGSCGLEHNRTAYGENLWAGTAGRFSPQEVVDSWFEEREHYDFARGGFSLQTGHFTQLVWQQTRALGCARSSCNGLDIWVCNYDPPGNVSGGYQENVSPSSCAR